MAKNQSIQQAEERLQKEFGNLTLVRDDMNQVVAQGTVEEKSWAMNFIADDLKPFVEKDFAVLFSEEIQYQFIISHKAGVTTVEHNTYGDLETYMAYYEDTLHGSELQIDIKKAEKEEVLWRALDKIATRMKETIDTTLKEVH
ncbi:hypothetical protein DH09_14020 [Bacillaceae bacterium JMAK1]|nr:hypothetical protein DH09_14020 [Bacillaceae bacterium JMAK1]